jgi:hypothetical protein
MSAANLLDRLQGARERGAGKWIARCPAHEDSRPSLAIARADDRWLIYCFGGCYPIDVMRAIGLELADLFDDRVYRPRGDRERPRLSAAERLELLEHEIGVAVIIANDFLRDRVITEEHAVRLAQACGRIGSARHA